MNPMSMAELGILDWIAAHCHNSFWDAVMPFITGLGDQGILWILLGVLILFFQKGERATGAQVLVSLLFSLILCNLMLKMQWTGFGPVTSTPRWSFWWPGQGTVFPLGTYIRLLCSGHSSSDEPLERKMDHSGCGCPHRVFPAVSLRSFSH